MKNIIVWVLISFLNATITPHYLHAMEPGASNRPPLQIEDPDAIEMVSIQNPQTNTINYLKDIIRLANPDSPALWKPDTEFLEQYFQKNPQSWDRIEKISQYLHKKLTRSIPTENLDINNFNLEFNLKSDFQTLEEWITSELEILSRNNTNTELQSLRSKIEELRQSTYRPTWTMTLPGWEAFSAYNFIVFLTMGITIAANVQKHCSAGSINNPQYDNHIDPSCSSYDSNGQSEPVSCYYCVSSSNNNIGTDKDPAPTINPHTGLIIGLTASSLLLIQFLPLLIKHSALGVSRCLFNTKRSLNLTSSERKLEALKSIQEKQISELEEGSTKNEEIAQKCSKFQEEVGLQNFESIIQAFLQCSLQGMK